MRRQSMGRRESRGVFRAGAERVHVKNQRLGRPMRGGIRL